MMNYFLCGLKTKSQKSMKNWTSYFPIVLSSLAEKCDSKSAERFNISTIDTVNDRSKIHFLYLSERRQVFLGLKIGKTTSIPESKTPATWGIDLSLMTLVRYHSPLEREGPFSICALRFYGWALQVIRKWRFSFLPGGKLSSFQR